MGINIDTKLIIAASINNEEEVNIKCLKVLFLSQKTAFAKRQKPTFINRKTGRLLIIERRF